MSDVAAVVLSLSHFDFLSKIENKSRSLASIANFMSKTNVKRNGTCVRVCMRAHACMHACACMHAHGDDVVQSKDERQHIPQPAERPVFPFSFGRCGGLASSTQHHRGDGRTSSHGRVSMGKVQFAAGISLLKFKRRSYNRGRAPVGWLMRRR